METQASAEKTASQTPATRQRQTMAPRKRPASMHAPFALASTSSPGGSRSHPAVLRPDFRIPDQADTASVSRNRIVSPRASVRSGRIGRRPTPIRPRQPLDPSPSPTGASEHARGNQAWRRTASVAASDPPTPDTRPVLPDERTGLYPCSEPSPPPDAALGRRGFQFARFPVDSQRPAFGMSRPGKRPLPSTPFRHCASAGGAGNARVSGLWVLTIAFAATAHVR